MTVTEAIMAIEQTLSMNAKANIIRQIVEQERKKAFENGYQKRVIDQLQAAIDGQPIGSHYNESALMQKIEDYSTNNPIV